MSTKLKIEQCILDCWKLLNEECKKYNLTVQKGIDHITILISHTTSLQNIQGAQIQETEIFKEEKNIQPVLMMALSAEISTLKPAIRHVLEELEEIHTNVIKQCDKIFNVYRSGVQCNLSLDDVTENSATSCSIGEKIEALDMFKRRFTNYHLGKMYSIEYYESNGDVNKLSDLWKLSDLVSVEQDLASILSS